MRGWKVIAVCVVVAAGIVGTAAGGTSAAPALTVREYPVPAGSRPHDVAPARDGGVWYTAQGSGELGWLDPKTGRTRHIPLGNGSAPHGVIVGPDGAPWITDGGLNAIVRVDPKTRRVRRFPLPRSSGYANLNTAAFDRRGVLWFTGQSGIYGRLDPRFGKVRVFPAPRGAGPYGITTTPSGAVYYASLAGSYLGRIDVARSTVRVLQPPTRNQGARRAWSDSKGRIWVSEWNAGKVAVYEPCDRALARVAPPGRDADAVRRLRRRDGCGLAERLRRERPRSLRPEDGEVHDASASRARPRTCGRSSAAGARCGVRSRASTSSSSSGRARSKLSASRARADAQGCPRARQDPPEEPEPAVPERAEDERLALLERMSGRVPDDAAVRDEDGDPAGGRLRPQQARAARICRRQAASCSAVTVFRSAALTVERPNASLAVSRVRQNGLESTAPIRSCNRLRALADAPRVAAALCGEVALRPAIGQVDRISVGLREVRRRVPDDEDDPAAPQLIAQRRGRGCCGRQREQCGD